MATVVRSGKGEVVATAFGFPRFLKAVDQQLVQSAEKSPTIGLLF